MATEVVTFHPIERPLEGKRDRSARERALLAAATRLFAQRGFESTTTREIAAEAGCAEGLIHRYFSSKEGLLLGIIRARVSRQVSDLAERLPIAATVEQEISSLVDWEVDCMWEDREFLGVVVPRALLDPDLGEVVNRVAVLQRGEAIAQRLKKFKEARELANDDMEAVCHAICMLGFTFGFVRPVMFRQNLDQMRSMAHNIAKVLARSIA